MMIYVDLFMELLELNAIDEFIELYEGIGGADYLKFMDYVTRKINNKITLFPNKKYLSIYQKHESLLREIVSNGYFRIIVNYCFLYKDMMINEYVPFYNYLKEHEDKKETIYNVLSAFKKLGISAINFTEDKDLDNTYDLVLTAKNTVAKQRFFTDGKVQESINPTLSDGNISSDNVYKYYVSGANYVIERTGEVDYMIKATVKNFDFDINTLPSIEELKDNKAPRVDFERFENIKYAVDNAYNLDTQNQSILKMLKTLLPLVSTLSYIDEETSKVILEKLDNLENLLELLNSFYLSLIDYYDNKEIISKEDMKRELQKKLDDGSIRF